MANCEECGKVCPANDRTFTDGGGIVCIDCRCPVCGRWHGYCAMPDCTNLVQCDPEEPGEPWAYCDECDSELMLGEDPKGGA